MSKSPDSLSDRRQAPRMKLSEIAYIGMGPENGGLVLDVSDGGLSFHSVAPVQPSETIRFLLSMQGQTRIEGAGEVVWTNELRTVCGMKFTSLSGDAREFLNNWTNKSSKPVDTSEYPYSSVSNASPPGSEAPLPAFSDHSRADAEPLFAIAPLNESSLSEAAGTPLWREPIISRIAFVFLATALTVTAYNYGVHVGKSQASSVAQAASNSTPPKGAQFSPPAPVSAPAVASEAPSVPNIQSPAPSLDISPAKGALVNTSKTIDAAEPSLESHTANASAPAALSEQGSEAGNLQLAAALAYLNGENGSREAAKALKLLWAAVGNGNSEAEVILAGLYIRGDGVAKNCEQGRVLLKAAMKSGNAQAKLKLTELKAHGCS